MVSMQRAASIRSGIIRRSFSVRASRFAVRLTLVYWASFLAMGESVAGGLVLLGYPPSTVKTERFGPTGG